MQMEIVSDNEIADIWEYDNISFIQNGMKEFFSVT